MTRPNDPGGAMTGATGDLTPDDADQPFVPAELREISDPEHQADLTTTQSRHVEEDNAPIDEASGAAPRDDGYGSSHGLSANDPAYRMASRGHLADEAAHRTHHDADGDDFSDQEDHF
jgi:hypothetical protein